MTMVSVRGDLALSDDRAMLDTEAVLRLIGVESYWAEGIPRDVLERAIANSLCIGVYRGECQVAFARVVTDRATFAWICDVIVDESERGNGIGKWIMESILAHPDLQGLRRFLLATRDAHTLYAKFGFKPLAKPENWMEIHTRDIYRRPASE